MLPVSGGSYPPTSVTRPDDVEGTLVSEALMGSRWPRGPAGLCSTHQAAPGLGNLQESLYEDAEGGCGGSGKLLPACGGWERNRSRMSGQVPNATGTLSPSHKLWVLCVTNIKDKSGLAPLSNGQLCALSVLPLRTLFIGVNAR